MRGVVVLVAVLMCAPAARAEQLAPDVASKLPVAEPVYCAADANDWASVLAQGRLPPDTRGFTGLPSGRIHLPAATCDQLRGPFTSDAALAYRALYHELIHSALKTTDESVADCVSLFMLRYWLRRFYNATAAQAQAAYVIAWADHLRQPTPYLGACVFEPLDFVSPLNGF